MVRKKSAVKIGWPATLALLGLLFAPSRMWAQGCALCATNAAATGPEGWRALNFGIILLLVPALLIFIAIFCVAFLNRNAEAFPDGSKDQSHSLEEPTELLQTSSGREFPPKRLERHVASG